MSLPVQTSDRPEQLPAVAYIRLHRAGVQVHKGVPLQLDAHPNPFWAGHRLPQNAPTWPRTMTWPRSYTDGWNSLNKLRISAKMPTETCDWCKGDTRKNYHRRVRFAPSFRVGDYIFLERPPLFRLAAELSASEGYNRLLRKKTRTQ